jgi:hypothetical protein
LLLLLLGACATPDEPAATVPVDDSAEVVPEDDTPYLGEVDADDGGGFDADEVQKVVGTAIEAARALHAASVIAAYAEVTADMDDCPTFYASDDIDYWYDSCETAVGTTYEGYAYTNDYVDYEGSGGNIWTGEEVNGVATVVSADGSTFEAAGTATVLSGTNEAGQELYYSAMSDGFAYDGAAADGTWLAAGLSPEIAMYALVDPASGGRALIISGRAIVDSEMLDAVVLDDITLFDEALGSACPTEPAGTVSVLDVDGKWTDLVFDGPALDGGGGEAEDCDGCAAAWQGAHYLGEACIDFSGLLDWEDMPFGE